MGGKSLKSVTLSILSCSLSLLVGTLCSFYMYDTINFKITNNDVGNDNFLHDIPRYLDDDHTTAYHNFNGMEVITGSIDNLKISINRYQVKIKDGSLCKWYLGDNFQTMGRQDTQRAIERLSDILHLPIDKATIIRLDIAQNFIVKHPIEVYLNHLGELRHSKRLQEPSGIYYHKNDERLCFYDKNREQKNKGGLIPELYKDRNVLRYEQRYLGHLTTRLKVPEVTGALLYDERFYMGLINRWWNTYKDISKINDITTNYQTMTSKKGFNTMAALALVKLEGGEVEFLKKIKEQQQLGHITRKQAYNLRQKIKKVCQEDSLTIENEAIKELDKKIKEAVKFYR